MNQVSVGSYLVGQGRHTDFILGVGLQSIKGEGQQVGLLLLQAAVDVGLRQVADRSVVDSVA